jgi:hypothetical protein
MMKRALVVVCLVALAAVTAEAGLNRTAVALGGSDLNPCSLQQPCATFAKAISETNPLGELIALDSGGYAGFTVDRAMTITAAPGAVVTVGPEPGVTNWAIKVNAPGKRVSIRGLMVVTVGSYIGIVAHDADTTYIDDVVIEGSGCDSGCAAGIFGRKGEVFVNNARIRNTFTGIDHNPMTASTMTVTNSNIARVASNGVLIQNYGKGVVRNTVVSHADRAFSVGSLAKDGRAELTLVDCMATASNIGVNIGNAGNFYMDRSSVTRNTIGLNNTGGLVVTHTNSMVSGNGTNTVGAMTANSLL